MFRLAQPNGKKSRYINAQDEPAMRAAIARGRGMTPFLAIKHHIA
jgi:hypothetical protein